MDRLEKSCRGGRITRAILVDLPPMAERLEYAVDGLAGRRVDRSRNREPMSRVLVQALIQQILEQRRGLVRLAASQRSKFEHWLKLELAAALEPMPSVSQVRLEDSYGPHHGRADVSFTEHNARWHVELKTSNVNWRAEGVENRTRPITKNIDSIAADVLKLRAQCGAAGGLAAFVLFPVPHRIWREERAKLDYHLSRIERECGLKPGSLAEAAGFVDVHPEYGLAVFVVEAAEPRSGSEITPR